MRDEERNVACQYACAVQALHDDENWDGEHERLNSVFTTAGLRCHSLRTLTAKHPNRVRTKETRLGSVVRIGRED